MKRSVKSKAKAHAVRREILKTSDFAFERAQRIMEEALLCCRVNPCQSCLARWAEVERITALMRRNNHNYLTLSVESDEKTPSHVISEGIGCQRPADGYVVVSDSAPGTKVYFLRGLDTRRVKVGWSFGPLERLEHLQTGCSEPLELVGCIAGGREVEQEIHRLLDGHGCRVMKGREWFFGPDLEALLARIGLCQ